jgi:hypothetical protein
MAIDTSEQSTEDTVVAQINGDLSTFDTNGQLRAIQLLFPGVNIASQMRTLTKEQAERARTYFRSQRDCAVANIGAFADLMTTCDESVMGISIDRIGYALGALVTDAVAGETLGDLADTRVWELEGRIGA